MAISSNNLLVRGLIALVVIACVFVTARRYRAHDHVAIVANTVGPFNNPTETYPVSNNNM